VNVFGSTWNGSGDGSGSGEEVEEEDDDEQENERPPSTFGERLRAGRDDEEEEPEEENEREKLQEQEGTRFHFLDVPMFTLVAVVTGEEDEETIHHVRAKLYALCSQNQWKERGTGLLKLNVRRSDGGGARLCTKITTSSLVVSLTFTISDAQRSGLHRYVECYTVLRDEVLYGTGSTIYPV
jgi:Ran-binding protein 3